MVKKNLLPLLLIIINGIIFGSQNEAGQNPLLTPATVLLTKENSLNAQSASLAEKHGTSAKQTEPITCTPQARKKASIRYNRRFEDFIQTQITNTPDEETNSLIYFIRLDKDLTLAVGVDQGRPKLVEAALNLGANPSVLWGEKTPLMMTSAKNYVSCLKLLLTKDTKEQKVNDALELAADNGHLESTKILLDHGGSPYLALAIGSRHNNYDISKAAMQKFIFYQKPLPLGREVSKIAPPAILPNAQCSGVTSDDEYFDATSDIDLDANND